ncbi:MAG: cell division protein ZapA, partial [Rickettsiales bacterium]|nr:cell division protein ZapA [Rickettsiales bacterium]
ISIANKKYQIGCETGQEERLHELSRELDSRASEILDKMGPMAENMLLVTLCVVMADELATAGDSDLSEILSRVREIRKKLNNS